MKLKEFFRVKDLYEFHCRNNQMRLFIVKILVVTTTIALGIGLFHIFTYKTQTEILQLTKTFHDAYKNQDVILLDRILADDLINTSSAFNGSYGKSGFLQNINRFRKNREEIISIKITPVWTQPDRAKPRITFNVEAIEVFDGKPEIYYGQYTFTLERKQTNWQIISMNCDINYRESKPNWLGKKIFEFNKLLKSTN